MPKKWETWWAEIKTVQQVKQEPCVQAKQNKEFIPQSLWVGRCSALPMKTIKCERGLGWQTPSLKMFHSYFFFSQICVSTMTSYGLEYPLGQPGSAVTLPNSLCTPRIPTGGVGWGEKILTLCKLCPAEMETSLYYQHYFQYKSKSQPRISCCEEDWLYSCQISTVLQIYFWCSENSIWLFCCTIENESNVLPQNMTELQIRSVPQKQIIF